MVLLVSLIHIVMRTLTYGTYHFVGTSSWWFKAQPFIIQYFQIVSEIVISVIMYELTVKKETSAELAFLLPLIFLTELNYDHNHFCDIHPTFSNNCLFNGNFY